MSLRSGLLACAAIAVVAACAGRSRVAGETAPPSSSAEKNGGAAGGSSDVVGLAICDVDAKEPSVKDLGACVQECDRGIASACSALASRAERGVGGLPRDVARAVGLHERACELRDSPSCVIAARMHAAGMGVSPNRAKQMELLSAACNLGDAAACSLPAKAYASGAGVSRDEHKARALWEHACMGGVETACDSLDAGL